jgi:hypothetical protein
MGNSFREGMFETVVQDSGGRKDKCDGQTIRDGEVSDWSFVLIAVQTMLLASTSA